MSTMGPLGCILDRDYTLESDDRVAKATGSSQLWSDSQTEFHGRWKTLKARGITSVILWPAYEKISGKKIRPHKQLRGTCVARGFEMAARMSYCNALFQRTRLGKNADLSYEILYAGSRNYPGKGSIRNGDGSVGAWAAEWLSLYGLCERGVYGSVDVSKDNEMLAVSLARSGVKLPKEVLDACKEHTWATNRCQNTDEIADSIASDFGVARCWDTLFGNRNSKGISRPADTGAHCQAVIGVAVSPSGEDIFIEIQSWGENIPSGPNKLETAGGMIELPAACYGVMASDYRQAMSRSRWWEAHAVSIRKGNEYR